MKNEAKDGQHYDIPEKVVDPPNYMRVEPKVKYDNSNYSTMNTMHRSPNKRKWFNIADFYSS